MVLRVMACGFQLLTRCLVAKRWCSTFAVFVCECEESGCGTRGDMRMEIDMWAQKVSIGVASAAGRSSSFHWCRSPSFWTSLIGAATAVIS